VTIADGPEGAAPTHDDARDLVRGAAYNVLGMVAKVSKVAFVWVAARYYGAEALGVYFLAWSMVDVASKFGLWGIDRSLIRDIARYSRDRSEATKDRLFAIIRFHLGFALALSLVTAAVLFLLAPRLALWVFHEPGLVTPARWMAWVLPSLVLGQVFIATTKALREMQYDVFIRQTLEPLVLLVGAVALMPLDLGARGLVLAHIAASLVALLAALLVFVSKYRFLGWRHAPLPRAVKMDALHFSSPIAAMDALNLLVNRMDILLIGALMNAAAAGVYGVAVEIISLIKRVRQAFSPIFAPIISELFYTHEHDRLRRNYVLLTRWLIAGTLLPTAAIMILPDQLLRIFGVDSRPAAIALVVLALAHGVYGVFSAAEDLLVMTGWTLLNTMLAGGMLAVNVAMGVLLIPRLGLSGAALSTCVVFILVSLARTSQCYLKLKMLPFSPALIWPAVSASLTIVPAFILARWLHVESVFSTVAFLALWTAAYAAVYFSGTLEPEEKELLSAVRGRARGLIRRAR